MGKFCDGQLKGVLLIDCGHKLVVIWRDRDGNEQHTVLDLPMQLKLDE